MIRKNIRTDQLKKNMIIINNVYLNNGVILIPEGTPVTKEVKSLLARHFIETVTIAHECSNRESMVQKTVQEKQVFVKAIEIAEQEIEKTLLDIVFYDKEVDTAALIHTINTIIDQTNSITDLCIFIHTMKKEEITTFNHSINVALIGQMLLYWLKEEQSFIEEFCLTALLHDIGILTLQTPYHSPLPLLKKGEYERHVINGYNLLKNKAIGGNIKQAILTHHEHLDGSGYPLKLCGAKIPKLSRILAIADTYDRLNHMHTWNASNPFEAIQTFEEWGYQKFDIEIMLIFLKNIANQFLNQKVVLSNEMHGTIVFIHPTDLSRPMIKIDNHFLDLSVNRNIRIVQLET